MSPQAVLRTCQMPCTSGAPNGVRDGTYADAPDRPVCPAADAVITHAANVAAPSTTLARLILGPLPLEVGFRCGLHVDQVLVFLVTRRFEDFVSCFLAAWQVQLDRPRSSEHGV